MVSLGGVATGRRREKETDLKVVQRETLVDRGLVGDSDQALRLFLGYFLHFRNDAGHVDLAEVLVLGEVLLERVGRVQLLELLPVAGVTLFLHLFCRFGSATAARTSHPSPRT